MKNLDWASLSFGYMKTDYNVRCYYRDGKWGEIEVCSDEYLKLHMAATCLHYGQEAFEGAQDKQPGRFQGDAYGLSLQGAGLGAGQQAGKKENPHPSQG